MLEHLLNGGIFMIPLAFLSILSAAIIVDRWRTFVTATADTVLKRRQRPVTEAHEVTCSHRHGVNHIPGGRQVITLCLDGAFAHLLSPLDPSGSRAASFGALARPRYTG